MKKIIFLALISILLFNDSLFAHPPGSGRFNVLEDLSEVPAHLVTKK